MKIKKEHLGKIYRATAENGCTFRVPIEDKGKELEVGVDLKSTSGVSPAFLGWTIEVEALEGEINA